MELNQETVFVKTKKMNNQGTIIRKYTAIQLNTETVNDNVNVKLSFGEISGPYYNLTHPTEEFETEEDAIEYACQFNFYGRWLIVPIINFSK